MHAPLFDRLAAEARDRAGVGPVLAPELVLRARREPWRGDLGAAFAAARAFVAALDRIAAKHPPPGAGDGAGAAA